MKEEGNAKVHKDAVLLVFAATLQKPHDISATAEKEKEAARRRPRHYLQNSKRTREQYIKSCHKSKVINSLLISFTKRMKRMFLLL